MPFASVRAPRAPRSARYFFIERGNAVWEAVLQAAQSLSLFAERRVVEIRMPSGKPGAAGAAALLRLLAVAGADLTVLIATERLDRESQESAWVRAVQTQGACCPSGRSSGRACRSGCALA